MRIDVAAQLPVQHDDGHTLTTGSRLHHIGFVVPRISDAVQRFVSGLGVQWDGKVHHDPVQTVKVTFLEHPSGNAPSIELVEPATQDSSVSRFLKRGGGLHHLCYEVKSLDAQLEHALSAGAILISAPCPAVAFDGRKIAWIITPDRLLIEYLAQV
jgi:methylmalonyl-CoA/ethylmalonyl-CoA epimerase